MAEFRVKANLVKKELVLLDGKSHQPIQKLNFGSCYYGCNLLSMAILYNSSPEKVDYVILLEEKGVGTEIVINNLTRITQFEYQLIKREPN